MLNVIFYSPLKTKTEETKVLQEDGTLKNAIVTTNYHTVRSFACNTMTHAKELFKEDQYLESFRGNLPSAQNVELIFSGTAISSLDGGISMDDDGNEITIPADFSSVTLADGMCKDCTHLQTINIDLSSLVEVKDALMECVSLTSFTGNLRSLQYGDSFFVSCSELNHFDANLDSLISGKKMFKYTKIPTFSNDLNHLVDGTEMFMNNDQLSSYTGTLDALEIGDSMFEACPNLTSLSSEITLNKLRSGNRMFIGTGLTDVSSFDLKALESGSEMFRGLTMGQWTKDMPALKVANNMFYECSKLYSFEGNLSSLENMEYMFYLAGSTIVGPGRRAGIHNFNPVNLNKVKKARYAFYQAGFVSWRWDMPSLEDGTYMFDHNTALTTFTGSLQKLKDGTNMFSSDSSLTTFISNLSSLEKADNMFNACKLSPESVMYIVDSIKDHGSGNKGIALGINCQDTTEAKEAFAQEAGYNTWQDMHDILVSKGWTPTWQYNFQ